MLMLTDSGFACGASVRGSSLTASSA